MIDLFSVPATKNETKMALFIVRYLEKIKIPFNIDDFGNIYIVKGISDTYPMFTAHLDTVHTYRDGYNCMIRDGIISAVDNCGNPVGVGGDDKNGIYVCLKMLETLPILKVVFFSGEEVGGIGSKNFNKKWLEDCRFIGGVDRKGITDFVTEHGGKTVSDDFLTEIQPLLNKYKRTQSYGLFTDAFSFSSLNISSFNMSCGYYAPHTSNETVVVQELEDTLRFCLEIANTLTKTYPHIKPVPTSYYPQGMIYHDNGFDDDMDYWWERPRKFYTNTKRSFTKDLTKTEHKEAKQIDLFPKIEDDGIDETAWVQQLREEAEEWKRWFPND